MAESDSSKISIYYGYSDDINILLGTYVKAPSSSDGNDHGGVYKYTNYYTMYNDGYYVYSGTLVFSKSVPSTQARFDPPFVNANYTINLDPTYINTYGISCTSRYTTNFVAYCSRPPENGSMISVAYTATGKWKL